MPPTDTTQALEPSRVFKCEAEVNAEMADVRAQAQTFFNLAAEQDRGLNAQERAEVNQLNAYYDKLDKDIRKEAQLFERMANDTARSIAFDQKHQQSGNRFAAVNTNLVHNKGDRLEKAPKFGLKNFTEKRFGDVIKANEAAQDMGRLLSAVLLKDQKSIDYCKTYLKDVMIQSVGGGTGEFGGVLVPEAVAAMVLDIRKRVGLAAALCRDYTMIEEKDSVPKRETGLTVYKKAEEAAITTSTKTWSEVDLDADDAYTLTYLSAKLLRGSVVDAAEQVVSEIAYSFSDQHDYELLLSDGSAPQPNFGSEGVIPFIAAGGRIPTASHLNWDDIDADLINELIGLLPDEFHGRANTGNNNPDFATQSEAVFVCSRKFWATKLEPILENAGGSSKYDISAASPYMYRGYRVMFSPWMPGEPEAEACPLLFGNFYDSTILGMRQNVTIAESIHHRFEYDQLAIRGKVGYDIQFHRRGDASNPGGIVGLYQPAAP